MKSKLIVKALLKFLMGIVFAGCLLFIPASTFKYGNAFFILLFMPIILVIRIINEEKVLENNLNGYKEYKKKVKYRLIPFIW